MVTVSRAWTLNVPALVLLMVSVQVSVQLPSPLLVGPASGVTAPTVPGVLLLGKVTVGVAKVGAPVPAGKAVTVIVKVSALPTALTGALHDALPISST